MRNRWWDKVEQRARVPVHIFNWDDQDQFDVETPGVHKFGSTGSFDTGDVPLDVWDPAAVGGYPGFIETAQQCRLRSANGVDTAAGTGAQEITVQGLDGDGNLRTVAVETNGVTNVDLGIFFRIFRAQVTRSGDGQTNAGRITIETNGGTAMATIADGIGQTLMAIYTIPNDYLYGNMVQLYATLRSSNAAQRAAQIALQAKPWGTNTWQTKEYLELGYPTPIFFQMLHAPQYDPLTDLRMRVLSVSSNGSVISGGFEIKFTEKE
jgi:hypothetical protein